MIFPRVILTLDYVPIGPRFSNTVLQALMVLFKRRLPKVFLQNFHGVSLSLLCYLDDKMLSMLFGFLEVNYFCCSVSQMFYEMSIFQPGILRSSKIYVACRHS